MRLILSFVLCFVLGFNLLLPTLAASTAGDSASAFGIKLFKDLAPKKKDANLLVSPFSISTGLAMAYNGATGDTKEAMGAVLGFGTSSNQEINTKNQAILKSLANVGANTRLQVANALFARQGIPFKEKFLAQTKTFYGATARSLNFNSPAAVGTINSWISESTQQKIPTVIDEIDKETILILVNAIYFKGNWENKFKKENTRDNYFHVPGRAKVDVKMMVANRDDFRYLETDQFQAISLPYKDKRLSMFVFLPAKNSDLQKFEADLKLDKLDKWFGSFSKREGRLFLPRFRIEDSVMLRDALGELGMAVAFDANLASFDEMASLKENIFIDEVIHRTFMEVNEEGTEAAAATTVHMGSKGFYQAATSPFIMVVDRPFFFVLRDSQTGSILFLGHVVNPKA